MKTTSNKLVLGIVPLICIVLAFAGMPYVSRFPTQIIDKLPYIPYLVFTGAIFMGVFFKRHRITLIALLLGLSYIVLHNIFVAPEVTIEHLVALSLASILLPLNMLALTGSRDQQILSVQSFIASAAILLQIVACFWLMQNYLPILIEWLLFSPEFLANVLPQSLPLAVFFAYAIGIVGLIVQVFKKGSVFEVAFLGALIASILSFQVGFGQAGNSVYMLVAGFLLIWGLVHNSYLIAYIDELTELPGRRAMNEEMSRLRGNYAIAMLDIDHFKKFNDTYGHDVGDQVLRMVASKIGGVHGGGKPFRYGGEEFAILFPGKDSKASFPFLSNLRETVDSARLILRNQDRPANKPENIPPRKVPWQEVHVTISIGVANSCAELATTQDVLKAADEALYRSKEKGRNRISQYSTKDYDPELEGAAVE